MTSDCEFSVCLYSLHHKHPSDTYALITSLVGWEQMRSLECFPSVPAQGLSGKMI